MLRPTCGGLTRMLSTFAYEAMGVAETPGIPCATVYGFLRALPGVHDLLVTVAARSSPADLAPAKGCQDHTSSSVRKKRRSSREALRPSHPALNVRDDAYAPLVEAGWRDICTVSDFRKEKILAWRPDKSDHIELAGEFRFSERPSASLRRTA